jgi:hypothetical protein
MKSTVLDLEVHSNAKKTYFVTQSLYRNGILLKGGDMTREEYTYLLI